MGTVATISVLVLVGVLAVASYASYRKHSRAARRRSDAALSALMTDAEQIAADARARGTQPLDPASADLASAQPANARPEPDPMPAADPPLESTDAIRDAYERGYRQGFQDGMATRAPSTD